MPAEPLTCPACGKPVSPDALMALCPACLLDAGLETGNGEAAENSPRFLPPEPGELAPLFPQLEILELIGRGGMGVVYKVRQKSLNRLVALKLLPPERVSEAGFSQRFEKEAQALATLNHPHIVTIHDFGQAGPYFYLLMEFVDGVNLRQAMRGGRLTPEQALAIVPPVCEALQYAHEQRIVHRDIKPENLLLDKKGRVKIADFGIARMLEAEAPGEDGPALEASAAGERCTFGALSGTPLYMAPEQKAHDPGDHRADIYSLGLVLYELLTGELPGERFEPPSSRLYGSAADPRLDEIVGRALAVKPEQRFQTAGEFRLQVETLTRAQPSPAPPRPRPSPARLTVSNTPPPTPPKMNVNRAPLGLAAVIAFAAVSLAAYSFVSHPHPLAVGNGAATRPPETRPLVVPSDTRAAPTASVAPPEPVQDRAIAVGQLLTGKAGSDRDRAFLNLAANLQAADLPKVFAMLLNLARTGQDVRYERSVLARRWGVLDPATALGYLNQVPVKDRAKEDFENVLNGWASTDPSAARDWLGNHRDHSQFDSLYLGYVTGFASQNLDAATSEILSTLKPSDKIAPQAVWRLAHAAHDSSPAALTAWFDQLPTSPDQVEFKRLAADDVVRLMPPNDFENNSQWIAAMAYQPWRNDPTIATFAHHYVDADPAAAMTWVQATPDRPKDGVIIGVGEIVNSWAGSDLDGLRSWLDANPSSPVYQQAVRDLALRLNGKDQTMAEYYAN